tara:strand:- start:8765 stop:9127 length:363 start_codon:yes stop_codon:yes gene_type:complete
MPDTSLVAIPRHQPVKEYLMLMAKNEHAKWNKRIDGVMDVLIDPIAKLRYRWEDEKKYEEFADYKTFAKRMVDELTDESVEYRNWTKAGTLDLFIDHAKVRITFSLSGKVAAKFMSGVTR